MRSNQSRERIPSPVHPTVLDYVAYHEAGHAVIAHVVGFVCRGATIVPKRGEYLGCNYYEQSWEKRGKLRDERSAIIGKDIVAMAGWLSEIAAFGTAYPPLFGGDDLLDIILRGGGVGMSERHLDRYLDRLYPTVWALLFRHWRKVEVVAEALLARHSLTGDNIDALIDSVTSKAERTRASRIAAARKPIRDALAVKRMGGLWSGMPSVFIANPDPKEIAPPTSRPQRKRRRLERQKTGGES